MNIGKAIKLCRTQKGLTRTELAKNADISISYLSLLEQGKRDPSLSTVEKLSNALNIPLSVLVFLASDKTELSTELTEKLSSLAFSLMDSDDD